MKPLVTTILLGIIICACSKEPLDSLGNQFETTEQGIESFEIEQSLSHVLEEPADQLFAEGRYGLTYYPAQLKLFTRKVDRRSSRSTSFIIDGVGSVNVDGSHKRVVLQLTTNEIGKLSSGKIILSDQFGDVVYIIRQGGTYIPKGLADLFGHMVSFSSTTDRVPSKVISLKCDGWADLGDVLQMSRKGKVGIKCTIGLMTGKVS